MPQLIHLQWFYELAEKPPRSSEASITYVGSVAALLQLLLRCSNTRLCVKYLYCWLLPAITVQLVPRATLSVTDVISQYLGAHKRGFCIQPTSSLFLSTKGQSFCSPPPLPRGGRKSRDRQVHYQIFQIGYKEGQHIENLISQTPASIEKRFKTVCELPQ